MKRHKLREMRLGVFSGGKKGRKKICAFWWKE